VKILSFFLKKIAHYLFFIIIFVGQNFSKYKHAGDVQCLSVSTAMLPWMDA
jgi:hypothetical protein